MKKTFYVEHEGKIIGMTDNRRDYRFAVIYKSKNLSRWTVMSYHCHEIEAEMKAQAYRWCDQIQVVQVLVKQGDQNER